ncbi:teichuronic acid biosynthesis glycosyltransferase TuaG [Sulfuritortus calidifontis]|uniref:Teichuronic acid biosynthesis glycosyltransferase TuaG n=1 Tax=Sulfuritortus calidifontis TaxID=1914471 RepID=A0A4R3JYW6_9PROT|nr:glycosyltransferase family 2 protein [Sulfuritortus calidifontis]TCS72483.1 teichuronic acid biosynthesis glycosyltransferase TuaG [Sulfuritortus calidifontis]
MALVSIITPAYKAADFVGEAIRSVQAQGFMDWEMLIVDDGSPDQTAAVVRGYCEKDSRVKLIRQKNSGPAMARQAALEAAQGRYIAFLDSDDCWLPEKLSRQLEFMHQAGAALSYTRFRRMSHDGNTVGHLIEIPDRIDYRGLLCNTVIATSTVIVDRQQTGPFRMTKTYYDDFALWLELLRRGHVACGLQQDLMRYRVLDQSVSRNKGKSAKMVWRIYRDVERLSMFDAAWCFANYAYNAWRKYREF